MPNAIKDSQIQEVAPKDVDYEIISPSRLVGSHANVVPLSSNAQSARLFYAARFVNQSMPIANRETPYVQTLDPEDADGRSFEEQYGEKMGAARWHGDSDGTVTAVTPDYITVKGGDGKEKKVQLYNDFQFNRKTALTSTAQVKPGDVVKPGQLLASSNYTDNAGTLSMGVNARTAVVPYKGYSMDDAIVVSESFAKKLKSEHAYEVDMMKDTEHKLGKQRYHTLFPMTFNRAQMATLDDNGVVKPGTVLHKGDPVILAAKPKKVTANGKALGRLSRIALGEMEDISETWEHDYPGYVTDSADGKKSLKAFISAQVPATKGDKFIFRNGQKCFAADTEILTERGWVKMPDLLENDKVAALFDGEAGKFEMKFVLPVDRTEYTFSGYLYGFESDKCAYLVTDYHRLWLRQEGSDKFEFWHAWAVHRRVANRETSMQMLHDIDEEPITMPLAGFFTEYYTGKVYCVQVPGLGVILTRRNGKQIWTGNSIISKILPDEQMLRSLDGEPFDVLLNPLAFPSRVNTSTLYELALGKIAHKTGKPYKVPAYTKPGESRLDFVLNELKKHGVDDTEEVFDPVLNLKLAKPVATGYGYVQKLHHVVESKMSARGNSGYDQQEQPRRGGDENAQAKRLGGLEVTAIMAKGGYEVLRDGSTVRGTRNDDYWRNLRQGYKPTEPGVPFVFEKFRALLGGAGMNARDIGKGTLRLSPFTDRDLDALSPVEIQNGKLVDPVNLEAVAGGLFDPQVIAGDKWGKISLPTKLPNPAFEKPIAHVLGISQKDLRRVLAGEITLKKAQGS